MGHKIECAERLHEHSLLVPRASANEHPTGLNGLGPTHPEYGSIPYVYPIASRLPVRVGASVDITMWASQRHSTMEAEEMMLAGNIAKFSVPFESVQSASLLARRLFEGR